MTGRLGLLSSVLSLIALGSCGCTIAPRSFARVNDPAPLVRARAIGLSQKLPENQAIPALIEQLNDADAVVRLASIEELKRRTGQDLGFVPWADPAERSTSVAAWKAWWNTRRQGLGVYASPQQATRVKPSNARRWRLFSR